MSAPELPGCTGVLLAGGRATRLGGHPKGLLRVNGEPIAARTLRLFARLCEASLVVANDPAPYLALGAPVVPDVIPGKGAPGGLHAALSTARTPWILAVACDMPFVSEEGARLLWSRREGAPAVLPERAGWIEPLHGLWSREILPALDAALRAGDDPSFHAVARACGARVVPEADWRAVDPALRAFENVNTPEDAARLGLSPGE